MLKILNRDYYQRIEAVNDEFPNCQFAAELKDMSLTQCRVIAVSDSIESDDELTDLIVSQERNRLILRGGTYGGGLHGLQFTENA
ncbi:MAG: hypothetical protein NC548_28550 [Lachnospiraceae bacterium]|nr:hypothetical protein [Lachnospiraceae bacterium]